MIASREMNASYGRKMSVTRGIANCLLRSIDISWRCILQVCSSGFLITFQLPVSTGGTSYSDVIKAVQKRGSTKPFHAAKKRRNVTGVTRLLLRLSNIFHRERNESGFICFFESESWTDGNSQGNICQSPLIHRCLRLISARYPVGYSSKI